MFNFRVIITAESPIAENIQQMFLDDLLTSYQKMEVSFSKELYLFYKSFEFRSLWDVSDRLANFERSASRSGQEQLQGVVQLNNAIQAIDKLENQGRQCFTKFPYTTNVHKWSFNNVKHAEVCTSIWMLCAFVFNFHYDIGIKLQNYPKLPKFAKLIFVAL